MLFYTEDIVQMLTKYINRRLRNDGRIVDWAFYMDGKDILVVRIDYLGNFHSRDEIMIVPSDDCESFQDHFDYCFNKHLDDWINFRRG